MNMFVHFFLVMYVIENNYVIMFISQNKVYGWLIPLSIAPGWGCFTVKTTFSHGLQTGLWWLMCNICIYILLRIRTPHFPLRQLFLGRKWLVMTLLLKIHHYFQLEVTHILNFWVAPFIAVFWLSVYTSCFTTSGLYL